MGPYKWLGFMVGDRGQKFDGGQGNATASLENYPFLTPAEETKKSTLCGASTCAILSRISNTIKPIVFKGPLPYPGSVLGERFSLYRQCSHTRHSLIPLGCRLQVKLQTSPKPTSGPEYPPVGLLSPTISKYWPSS